MGDVRISQVIVEALSDQPSSTSERVTQVIAEVLSDQPPTPGIRVSQVIVETMSAARVTLDFNPFMF